MPDDKDGWIHGQHFPTRRSVFGSVKVEGQRGGEVTERREERAPGSQPANRLTKPYFYVGPVGA